MSEPSGRDRAEARRICLTWWRYASAAAEDAIAEALAQAREEVLGPFVALAEELEAQEQRCRDEESCTRIISEQLGWKRLADNLHNEAARVRAAITEATGGGR